MAEVDTRIGYLCPNDFLTVALVVILRGDKTLIAYRHKSSHVPWLRAVRAVGGLADVGWAEAVGSIGCTKYFEQCFRGRSKAGRRQREEEVKAYKVCTT